MNLKTPKPSERLIDAHRARIAMSKTLADRTTLPVSDWYDILHANPRAGTDQGMATWTFVSKLGMATSDTVSAVLRALGYGRSDR